MSSSYFHPILVENRVRAANEALVNPDGAYVLYWMIAHRRPGWSYSLQRAADHAQKLGKPLVVLEALRCDYRWNSARIHQFVIDGMADTRKAFEPHACTYYPYLEPELGHGKGLLKKLASEACVVVTDDFPCYFLPQMVKAAAAQCKVLLEAVDTNGLMPLKATPKAFDRAVDFRRFLQRNLEQHLDHPPLADPLKGLELPRHNLSRELFERWPMATAKASAADFPVDQSIPSVDYKGGWKTGEAELHSFVHRRLSRYEEERSEPSRGVSSGLSPYLHFGYVSPHQVLHELALQEKWNPHKINGAATGKKAGWWGMSSNAEAFLDEIITWRELGYVYSHHNPETYDRYDSLPAWALKTLEEHSRDERPHLYTLKQLDEAKTYDTLWNAAQRQLVGEGRIHNYLRMLWGKKVLEWSATPQLALKHLIELNNKYALDGRDPNSYSGIFWCFGRFDRPWFDREIFGTVRYMTSDSTRRKFKVDAYIEKWNGLTLWD
jgi:deoxyribodipyrimidine photo-lyase